MPEIRTGDKGKRDLEFEKLTATLSDAETVFFSSFFLVGYVEERRWWPIQSPNKGRKKKAIITNIIAIIYICYFLIVLVYIVNRNPDKPI